MDYNWSLKEIYPSFESKEFREDINKLDDIIEEINLLSNKLTLQRENGVENIENYINNLITFTSLRDRLESFTSLNISENTNNKEALKYSDIIDKKITNVVKAITKIEKYISDYSDIDSIINKSNILKEHEFIIKDAIRKNK